MSTLISRIRRLSIVMVGGSFLLAGVVGAAPPDDDGARLPDGAGPLIRAWQFKEYDTNGRDESVVAFGGEVTPVRIDEEYNFGPTNFGFGGGPHADHAIGEIHSKRDGNGFEVLAQTPDDGLGNRARLVSYQAFTKDADNATLEYFASEVHMFLHDENGTELTDAECDEPTMTDCPGPIEGEVSLDVAAYTTDEQLMHTAGGAMLTGWRGHWTPLAWSEGFATTPLWTASQFHHSTTDVLAHHYLNRTTRIAVDLGAVPVGGSFTVRVISEAAVFDRRIGVDGPGSAAMAWLTETTPAGAGRVVTSGLTAEGEPVLDLPPEAPLPVCQTGPDPAAGELQFSAAAYRVTEAVGAGPQILVTRTGGRAGAVSATVTTSDDTAGPGDYRSTTTTVRFADGDSVAARRPPADPARPRRRTGRDRHGDAVRARRLRQPRRADRGHVDHRRRRPPGRRRPRVPRRRDGDRARGDRADAVPARRADHAGERGVLVRPATGQRLALRRPRRHPAVRSGPDLLGRQRQRRRRRRRRLERRRRMRHVAVRRAPRPDLRR